LVTTESLRAILQVARTGLYFNTAKIGLFVNDISLTPDMIKADFTEADYTGYAALDADVVGPVTWDDAAGNAVQSFEGVHFQPSGTAVTNVIVGWFLFLEAGELLGAEKFPVPISMAGTADAIDFAPVHKIGQPIPA